MRKHKKNLRPRKVEKKHRYFYANVSFMSAIKLNTITRVEVTVEAIGERPFFPVIGTIKWCAEQYKDVALIETIQVNNVIEMSKEDYLDFKKLGRGTNTKL